MEEQQEPAVELENISEEPKTISNATPTAPEGEVRQPPGLIHSIILGIAFLLIFAGSNTAMSLLTPLFGDVGLITSAIWNVTFCLSAFFAPVICEYFGSLKRILFFGGLGYVALIGFGILGLLEINYLVLIGAVIVGVAGGPLWCAQGLFIARHTIGFPEITGKHNGIFFAFFALNAILGNTIGGLIFYFGGGEAMPLSTKVYTLVALAISCTLGTLTFLFLTDPPTSTKVSHTIPLKERFLGIFAACKNYTLITWMPYMINFGLTCTFSFMALPMIINRLDIVPWAYVVYGVGNFACSLSVGKMSDILPIRFVIGIHFVIMCFSYSLIFYCLFHADEPHILLVFLISGCFGMLEGYHNTAISALIMKTMGADCAGAIIVFRILSSSTQAISAFTLIYISNTVYMIFFSCWTCLSMFSAFFLSEIEFTHGLQEHSPPMRQEDNVSHYVVQVGAAVNTASFLHPITKRSWKEKIPLLNCGMKDQD